MPNNPEAFQAPTGSPDLSPANVRAILERANWKPEAIDTLLANTDFEFDAGYKGNSPRDRNVLADASDSSWDTLGRNKVRVFGREGQPTDHLEGTIEHEAHHVADFRDPKVRDQVVPTNNTNGKQWADWLGEQVRKAVPEAADAPPPPPPKQGVIDDINALRQYAATHSKDGGAELFDAANQALFDLAQDPQHLNHALAKAASIKGAPDWYRERYFNYLQDTPDATGAQPNPAQASGTRAQGQDVRTETNRGNVILDQQLDDQAAQRQRTVLDQTPQPVQPQPVDPPAILPPPSGPGITRKQRDDAADQARQRTYHPPGQQAPVDHWNYSPGPNGQWVEDGPGEQAPDTEHQFSSPDPMDLDTLRNAFKDSPLGDEYKQ